jgi:hypothetical protein
VCVKLGDGRGGSESLETDRRSLESGGFFKLQCLLSYNRANPLASVTDFSLPACTSILISLSRVRLQNSPIVGE